MATGVTSSITSNVSFTSKYQLTTDDDTLIIQGAIVTLNAPQGEIFTREGNDTVRVENTTVEAKADNLALYLGDGDDCLSIRNSTISAPVYAGEGNDYIRIEGTLQTSTNLNRKLFFGNGNDTLELIAMLENVGSIDFGTGRNKILFNGGALLGTGDVGAFADLEVSLSGGTTGRDMTLSGEQTTIKLNGSLFGTTDSNSVFVSDSTIALTVGNNIRSNVRFNLSGVTLVQSASGQFEISEHSGYAFTVDAESNLTIHDIVTMDGGSILGTSSTLTVSNSDFSNSSLLPNMVLKNNSILTGTQLSFTGNQGKGALQIDNSVVNVTGFRANNNKTILSSYDSFTSYGSYERVGSAATYTSAYGGAVLQNNGNATLISATFSGNIASAYASAYAEASKYYYTPDVTSIYAFAYASAFGGAICRNGGGMALTSATFSRNVAAAYACTYARASASNSSNNYEQMFSEAYGGAIAQNGGSMTLTGATFTGNIASASASAFVSQTPKYQSSFISALAYGGAICINGGEMTVSGGVFSGNTVSANASGRSSGALAIYGKDTINNSVYGGAIYLTNAIANVYDTVFSGNIASANAIIASIVSAGALAHGGAIYLDRTTLNYTVNSGKTVKNTGNKAEATASRTFNVFGEEAILTSQSAGGWLYAADASTINIVVGSNATLEIGDSSKYTNETTKDDSIAGASNSLITKSGTGIMVVNSDISGYTGKWSVNEGTLHLRRTHETINLDNWTIGTNGKLILSVEQDTVNMGMSKKVGQIDFGGGSDIINTNGYDLTAGDLLIGVITINGTGRVSARLTNRSTTAGNTITLNGTTLDCDFTGNQYVDTIIVIGESTIGGKLDMGGGNDVITATAKTTFTNTLQTGAGNDSLTFTDAVFEETVNLGDGGNTFSATGTVKFFRALSAGSGDDTLTFADVTFENDINLGNGDNSLTIDGNTKIQGVSAGTGADTITLNGDSTISGEISLGTGVNSIYVEKSLAADRIRLTQSGKTTVYVYLGSSLIGNELTVYSDESADRETVTLDWHDQTGLDKVRILVSSDPTSFQKDQYEFAVELYNQSKSFTLDLQKGYFLQFQAQDDNGWKQRLLTDHIAPSQVTGVRLSGNTLSWDEAHDNPGGNGVKQYHVEISQDDSFSTIWKSDTVTGTECTISSLPESALYFRVSAEDYTNNIGTWSETVSGFYDQVPPSVPTNVQTTVDGYSATLSWTASVDGGSGVSRYEYRIAMDSSFGQIVSSGTTEACSITIENLKYGTYYWQVRASDVAGNNGAWSQRQSFATDDTTAPDTPANLSCTVNDKLSCAVVQWTASADDSLGSGLKEYELQLATDLSFGNIVKNISVTTLGTTIEGLENASYYMRVRSVDKAGNKSGWTETKNFIINKDTTPPTVTDVKADITTPTKQNVTVTATFSDDRELAQLLYRIGTDGQWQSYVNGVTVTENTTVYFKAVDATGNESQIASCVIGNIDKNVPTVKNIKAIITSPNDGGVTVTATFSDDRELAQSLYRIGTDGQWQSYVNGVTVTENTTVYFKAVDVVGNESPVVGYAVTNISSGLIVSSGQSAFVSSGLVYKHTTVLSGGKMFISSSGIANSTTVNSSGFMHVSSGGMANSTIISSGLAYVNGVANNTTLFGNGFYYYYRENKIVKDGVNMIIDSGGTANDTTVNSGGVFDVSSGGMANNTTVNSEGELLVSSGGAANNTTVNHGHFSIYSSGTANSTTVNYCGAFNVIFGGIANSTTVNSRGLMYVYSGGIANSTTVNSYGIMYISSGGTANSTTVNSDGDLRISSGGTANSTTVDFYGNIRIYSSGMANDTTVNSGGDLYVSSGGMANNTTVYSGGNLIVSGSGVVTGKMTFESGAIVSMYDGATLDFDLRQTSAGAAALVNDWSIVQGTPLYTLTASDSQEKGTYLLAEGATGFSKTITVQNTVGESLGSLTVDNTATINGTDYRLTLDNGKLALNIEIVALMDTVAPTITSINADITAPTNQNVTVKADFVDNVEVSSEKYRINDGEWSDYPIEGVTISENATVFFQAFDKAGNQSEIASCAVTNIDRIAPSAPSGLMAAVSDPTVVLIWNPSTDASGIKEYVVKYSCNGQEFSATVNNTNYILTGLASGSWAWSVQAIDGAGNESAVTIGNSFDITYAVVDPELVSDVVPQTQTWEKTEDAMQYIVEYSTDNFEHVIHVAVNSNSLDSFQMPANYQMRVKADGGEWSVIEPVDATETATEPKLIISNGDGTTDVFFANSIGTWEAGYVAQHVGSTEDSWGGTKEYVTLLGKNKLADIIEGSTDANILLMTDDDNGDGLFVDDIYSALPGLVSEQQSRIAQIDEIRAGFGDDIVDMTSQRFEYVGDGLTIRGGDGNDTIWANKGNNFLFGDAGNDRIVGASGNDVIVGGIGNDRMHGGGGDDVFAFCDNWGSDNVEQLTGGSVTLWFASGSEANWDPETLTYTDGDNSVKVSGVTADKITRIFGDDGSAQFATLSSMGAFFDATTERIFEESGKGILASL